MIRDANSQASEYTGSGSRIDEGFLSCLYTNVPSMSYRKEGGNEEGGRVCGREKGRVHGPRPARSSERQLSSKLEHRFWFSN
jgi:hypothetical protein